VRGGEGNLYGTTPGFNGDNGTVFRLTMVPERPALTIIPSAGSVILTWPTSAGLSLQFTTNLGSSTVWTTNTSAPVIVNGQYVVTNPISGTQRFFRLSQ
jgi:hypothetical protein